VNISASITSARHDMRQTESRIKPVFLIRFSATCFLKKQEKVCVKCQGIMMPNKNERFYLFEKVAFHNILRNSNGNWNVPCVNWNGSEFNRNANWLDNEWNSNNRVVLVVTLSYCHSVGSAGHFPRDGFLSMPDFSSHRASAQLLLSWVPAL